MRQSQRCAALLLAVGGAGQGGAVMPPPSPELLKACEPLTLQVQRAMLLRDAGKFKAARDAIEGVVAQRPDSFRGNYILANILMESAQQDEGRKTLEKVIRLFPSLPRSCQTQTGWYSVYGYAGAEYYSLGDSRRAEAMLLEGYRNSAYLYPGSKQALLNNLGLLYFKNGKLSESERFYREAVAAGSKMAVPHLQTVHALILARKADK